MVLADVVFFVKIRQETEIFRWTLFDAYLIPNDIKLTGVHHLLCNEIAKLQPNHVKMSISLDNS